MEGEAAADADDAPTTFGEAPAEAEDARKRFEEQAVQRFKELRSDMALSAELNAALAQAVGLDASMVPPDLLRKLEETAKRESQAEPPPLPAE